jgi:hypothetical protein
MTDRFQTAVLCEFITRDISNKHSLIGVFSGDIIVSEMPATLRLALYLEVFPSSTGLHEISLKFNLGGKTIAEATAQSDVQEKEKPIILVLFPVDIGVDQDTVLTLEAATTGNKSTTIIEKKIYKGEVTPPTS